MRDVTESKYPSIFSEYRLYILQDTPKNLIKLPIYLQRK